MPDLAEPLEFRFDNHLLDRSAGVLLRLHPDGQTSRVPLGTRAFRILCLLVERHGAIVTRQEIMDAVWPDVVVEENNLSVQLSNLRRALDADRGLGSCIQTLPGRGYRFLPVVTPSERSLPDRAAYSCVAEDPAAANVDHAARSGDGGAGLETADTNPAGPQSEAADDAPAIAAPSAPQHRRAVVITTACFCVAVLVAWFVISAPLPRTTPVAATAPATPVAAATPPVPSPTPASVGRLRLSVVVLPFNKFGDGVDDDTVDAVTEDLTAAITRWHDAQVTARNTALTYKNRPFDMRRVGEELGVRFAVTGNLRRRGAGLRVNVQLVSAETGAQLWADHFDAEPDAGGYSLEDIIRHMALALWSRVADAESARIARGDPGAAGAADSLIRAGAALYGRPTNPRTNDQVIALLEHAAALDPNSAVALAGLAEALLNSINPWSDDPGAPANLRRVEDVITRAELIAPEERLVMGVRVYLLAMQRRCPDAAAAARRASEAHPDLSGPHLTLGICRIHDGMAAEAIPAIEQSIRVNPRNPAVFIRYHFMGYALLFLGRYDEAVSWLQKALAAHPSDSPEKRGNIHAAVAAAQALARDMAAARQSAAEAIRLWPTLTARSYYPLAVSNPVAVAQIARMRDGLRLAGIRDHADEDADHGLPADEALHTTYDAPTPLAAPGVRTIRTSDLAALMQERRPLVLDASNPWGQSIPGAIVLGGVGVGGSTSDEPQVRLRKKMRQLTGGNLDTPIVTVGWNAERFQGRNLALRLVALGYSEVYWYRGGREAWMAAGLPVAEVTPQDW